MLDKKRLIESHELMQGLGALSKEDIARTMFQLVGFMSVQDREVWDKFYEGVQSSPYYTTQRGGEHE